MERKDHFMCESCGTVAATRTKTTRFDRLLRHISGQKRFTCGQCGWTGLRNWSHTPAAIALEATASRSRTQIARFDSSEHDETTIDSGLELLAASGR